ncbi:WD40-repeat-containing domain protein [Choanephora cucurbitarum]|nr:WD40-repeat-containing domain protein [Choanephora cucurbitarum]
MTENSSVFGLRHQARCLSSVTHNTEQSQFLTGSIGAKDNIVCLLEYNEDEMVITSTPFAHPEEVWDIASCPTNPDLFFTCHSPVSGNPREKKATLWQKPTETMPSTDSVFHLESLCTMDFTGIQKVLWDKQSTDKVIAMENNQIRSGQLAEATYQHAITLDASPWLHSSTTCLSQLRDAVWNPHQAEVIAVGGQALLGWDLRSGKSSICQPKAHQSTVRAVDINPNRPYHVVTGGDDALAHLWDVRQLDQPLMTMEGHSHWIWSVAFNPLQDQLLLTSSSDTLVNLHNAVSLSSATYEEEEEEEELDKPSDGLVCTFDQHEDSVYQVAWSSADVWTFASVSYAGRIVINQVPQQEKFKILGL